MEHAVKQFVARLRLQPIQRVAGCVSKCCAKTQHSKYPCTNVVSVHRFGLVGAVREPPPVPSAHAGVGPAGRFTHRPYDLR